MSNHPLTLAVRFGLELVMLGIYGVWGWRAGQGPLAVKVTRGTAVPEYHAPAERWRIQHPEALNRGDFSQKECILCHNPRTGCNQCHGYAGVKPITVPEAALFWPAHVK